MTFIIIIIYFLDLIIPYLVIGSSFKLVPVSFQHAGLSRTFPDPDMVQSLLQVSLILLIGEWYQAMEIKLWKPAELNAPRALLLFGEQS